jgi:hypothetical protein
MLNPAMLTARWLVTDPFGEELRSERGTRTGSRQAMG